jgi:hypothetical protein
MQIGQLALQFYNNTISFVTQNVVPVADNVFSAATTAIMHVASIDSSLSKITCGITLVGASAIGMKRSHIIDNFKEIMNGAIAPHKTPNYRLALASTSGIALGSILIYNGAMEFYLRIMPASCVTNPQMHTVYPSESDPNFLASKEVPENNETLDHQQAEINASVLIGNCTKIIHEEPQKMIIPQHMLVIRGGEFDTSAHDERFQIFHEMFKNPDYFQDRALKNKEIFHIKYKHMSSGICQELTSYTEEEKLKPDVLELFNHGTPISMLLSDDHFFNVHDLYENIELIDCIKRNLNPDSQIFLKSCDTGRSTQDKYFDDNWKSVDLSAYPKNFAQSLADLTGHTVHASTYTIYPGSECKIDWDDEKNRAKLSCIPNSLYSRKPYFEQEYELNNGQKGKFFNQKLAKETFIMKEMVSIFHPSDKSES